jgi:hypothetical protein
VSRFFALSFFSRFTHLCPQESHSDGRKLENFFITSSPHCVPNSRKLIKQRWLYKEWIFNSKMSMYSIHRLIPIDSDNVIVDTDAIEGFNGCFCICIALILDGSKATSQSRFLVLGLEKEKMLSANGMYSYVWKYCNTNLGIENAFDFTNLPTQFLELVFTHILWQIGQEKPATPDP